MRAYNNRIAKIVHTYLKSEWERDRGEGKKLYLMYDHEILNWKYQFQKCWQCRQIKHVSYSHATHTHTYTQLSVSHWQCISIYIYMSVYYKYTTIQRLLLLFIKKASRFNRNLTFKASIANQRDLYAYFFCRTGFAGIRLYEYKRHSAILNLYLYIRVSLLRTKKCSRFGILSINETV